MFSTRGLNSNSSSFNVFKHIINAELTELESYISEISTELAAKQSRLNSEFISAKSQATSDDEEYEVHSSFEEELNKYWKVFPAYTFNPALLSLYSLLETWLKQLCEHHSSKGFSKLRVSDLDGNNYIEKSRKYLTIVAEIDLDPVDELWKRITYFQKIRNCIAHNNSSILKKKEGVVSQQELFKPLKLDPTIQLDEITGDFYIKNKDFLLGAIGVVREYMLFVIEALSQSRVVARNTTMPYNNAGWGEEKTKNLLKDIIHGLSLLENNEVRTDEFKDIDVKYNIEGMFSSMAYDVTKLYAFFCDGEWQPTHRDLIVSEKQEGLAKLSALYKGHYLYKGH